MNEKEVAEIRRRYKPEKNNITHIYGCYVNEQKEMVAGFDQPLSLLPEEALENMLSVLKRTLSGTVGKQLLDLSFSTDQVVDSEEHRLLMALRDSGLQNQEAVQAFFQRVTDSLSLDGTYVILLAYDTYDIPYHSKDGSRLEDASTQVYSYILCSICPVKPTKPALSYHVPENLFRNLDVDWVVAPPALGFLFPAFDDRSANIYEALYYSKDTTDGHQDFVDAIFNQELPMPAQVQKETFQALLQESLSEECSYDVVQTVHEQLCGMIEEHKANKEEAPLVLTKGNLKTVLQAAGVQEEKLETFTERYDQEFGSETKISPKNLVDSKKFQVCTPEVTIQVSPECADMVETRIINGVKYIMIRATEGVEVNGVAVSIHEEAGQASLPQE